MSEAFVLRVPQPRAWPSSRLSNQVHEPIDGAQFVGLFRDTVLSFSVTDPLVGLALKMPPPAALAVPLAVLWVIALSVRLVVAELSLKRPPPCAVLPVALLSVTALLVSFAVLLLLKMPLPPALPPGALAVL